jgi:hypothetical protein
MEFPRILRFPNKTDVSETLPEELEMRKAETKSSRFVRRVHYLGIHPEQGMAGQLLKFAKLAESE